MLNAHTAACRTSTQILQTPRPIARERYRMRPGSDMAVMLGCQCHRIAPLIVGVDASHVRISTDCVLHGIHPDTVPAYV